MSRPTNGNRRFKYQIWDDGVEITGYEGDIGETLVVPEEVDGRPVRKIGRRAFQGRSLLTSVELPEGLQTIGNLAFKGCSLGVVKLPSTLEEIGGGWDCIGFEIPESRSRFRVIDGVLFDKEAKTALAYPGNRKDERYYVPEGVETIGPSAFEGCSLTRTVLPKSLKTIEFNAFLHCNSLTSVEFHEGLQSIGDRAFEGCNLLAGVKLPGGLQTLGAFAFSHCASLASVELPEGLQTIMDGAFEDCNALTSVALPEGLQTLGAFAFSGCSSLASVELPEGLQTVGAYAFSGCSSLESVKLPDGLRTLESSAFKDCQKLRSVHFPNSLKTIGESAFHDCHALASVALPRSLKKLGLDAFPDDVKLTAPSGSWAAKWLGERK